MKIIAKNLAETIRAGREFAAGLKTGGVIGLYGELGAGKTSFVKGVAGQLGIKTEVKSPTFTLMNIYDTGHGPIRKLVHIDTYRLKNSSELIEIGFEDYLNDTENLILIEWPEQVADLIKNKSVTKVNFDHAPNNSRSITVEWSGA